MLTPGQANKADAIDLTTYSAAALRDATTFTALLGLLHLCIALFCLVAVICYRALVPLIYLWLLLEFLARRVILELYPMDRVHGLARGSVVNLVLLTMLALGLALSVWSRRDAQVPATT